MRGAQARTRAGSPGALARALALAGALAVCALAGALAGCGNTLQDQPIPHNELEGLELSHFPVYWLGASFRGLGAAEATGDTSGAVSLQYGNCVLGGEGRCVPPLRIVTSPDNSFVPGETGPHTTTRVRGVRALVAEEGRMIAVPTGGVVVDIYADSPALATAAAQTMAPINVPGAPQAPLPAKLADTGFASRPLALQVPPPLAPLTKSQAEDR